MLTPAQRHKIVQRYQQGVTVTQLARRFKVSRVTIYATLRRAKRSLRETHISFVCAWCGAHGTRLRSREHPRMFCHIGCYTEEIRSHLYQRNRQGQREARKVVERFFPLEDRQVVHHVDGNCANNAVENLVVFPSHRAHMRFHRGGKATTLWQGDRELILTPPKK